MCIFAAVIKDREEMRKIYATIIALLTVLQVSAQGWPADYKGVMLQGFAWDSYSESQWPQLESQADEIADYFDLIWVPNSAYAGSMTMNMGYHPVYWFKQDCAFGTEDQLRSMIKTYKDKGVGFIADIVINHRNGIGAGGSWVDFPAETYKGETYQLGLSDICKDDECASKGYSPTGAADTGEKWDGARDLDHTSDNVQKNVNAYLDFLKNDVGYEGFRYDFVKGYAPKYTGLYNATAKPTYSVGEYWDGNVALVKNWINGTKQEGVIQSAAFDFPLKYYINDAIGSGTWSRLDGESLASNKNYKRYSVTFVDNHDSYRDNNKCKANLEAANAYILTMPGTPCVFLNHWTAYKTAIKKMVFVRKKAEIANTSEILESGQKDAGYYVKVKGDKGTVLLVLGNAPSVSTTGFKLATEGKMYSIYVDNALDISGIEDIKSEEETFKMPDCCTPEEGKMYAFFEVPSSWGSKDIYCWCWNDKKNFTGGNWPGVKCTKVGTADNGNAVWKWIGPDSSEGTPTGIIFSANGSPQTGDYEYKEGGYYDSVGYRGTFTTTGISKFEAAATGATKVYSISGKLLRTFDTVVDNSEATKGLASGLYIVNGKKQAVNSK